MIVPSIDLMGGQAVQLVGGRDKAIEAGDPRPIAERFAVAGDVAVIDLDAALGTGDNSALIRDLVKVASCRVGGGIRTAERALGWLDAGAAKVILGTRAVPEVLSRLPRDRVIAALDARDGDVVVEGWVTATGRRVEERMAEVRDLVSGFLVTLVESEGRMRGIDLRRVRELVAAAGGTHVTVAGGVTTVEEVAAIDRLGADCQVGMALYTGRLGLADAIAAPLVSDRPDGLWPTVVADEGGAALGLAWSDLDSLREAVRTRRGVYHSRKRGLWVKGESSGATQDLLRVDLDCDRDAIRFTVRQHGGGFCHRDTRTCWDPAQTPRARPIPSGRPSPAAPATAEGARGLRRLRSDEVPAARRDPVDAETIAAASAIVDDVRRGGEAALRAHAERRSDLAPGDPLVFGRDALAAALAALPAAQRDVLARTAARIRAFAEAQRAALADVRVEVPGGLAGHAVVPVDRAGCYAPGGRFPLPSSVLMTVLAARAAGVPSVWVASPRPAPVTLAAAAVAGADALLAAGGAHAIAALAFGAGPVPACDAVVGPGNRWVTAAKQVVSGHVRIDMLAGPSELVVVADGGADPALVAADLLAQAEHDPDALPVLVAIGEAVADAVDAEVARQLATLPTAGTAAVAIASGFAVVVRDAVEAAAACDRIAPEHLELALDDAAAADVANRVRHCGALFAGPLGGEVLGDYGAGPSHVLPTGGTARHTAGLSVLDFLRVRTWLDVRDREAARPLVDDAVVLARMEGLEGHARAAERRR